jgi:hypothetical protein
VGRAIEPRKGRFRVHITRRQKYSNFVSPFRLVRVSWGIFQQVATEQGLRFGSRIREQFRTPSPHVFGGFETSFENRFESSFGDFRLPPGVSRRVIPYVLALVLKSPQWTPAKMSGRAVP